MKKKFSDNYKEFELLIDGFIEMFDNFGEDVLAGRNKLKLFQLHDKIVNIKSFKVPNFINQVVYRCFRKSKAERSFVYANKLIDLGIGTPQPIAYYEFPALFLFKKSFYLSEHLDYDLTYRELITDLNYPDYDTILRSFTRFTFGLHEKGVRFLDHSPGNTLIKKKGNDYHFYLVDLNRMKFEQLDFETRIKNFSRLTTDRNMIEITSDEYAKCSGEDYNKIFDLMWQSSVDFDKKLYRRRDLKEKIFFWREI